LQRLKRLAGLGVFIGLFPVALVLFSATTPGSSNRPYAVILLVLSMGGVSILFFWWCGRILKLTQDQVVSVCHHLLLSGFPQRLEMFYRRREDFQC
jgi:hypothetical protein